MLFPLIIFLHVGFWNALANSQQQKGKTEVGSEGGGVGGGGGDGGGRWQAPAKGDFSAGVLASFFLYYDSSEIGADRK